VYSHNDMQHLVHGQSRSTPHMKTPVDLCEKKNWRKTPKKDCVRQNLPSRRHREQDGFSLEHRSLRVRHDTQAGFSGSLCREVSPRASVESMLAMGINGRKEACYQSEKPERREHEHSSGVKYTPGKLWRDGTLLCHSVGDGPRPAH
jgi:hypothetical protein